MPPLCDLKGGGCKLWSERRAVSPPLQPHPCMPLPLPPVSSSMMQRGTVTRDGACYAVLRWGMVLFAGAQCRSGATATYGTLYAQVGAAICLRRCYAMPGTKIAYGARCCCAMSGTEIAYGTRCR
eukprot:1141524-Rhodomonas_salina.1